jgi:hypothetical protein
MDTKGGSRKKYYKKKEGAPKKGSKKTNTKTKMKVPAASYSEINGQNVQVSAEYKRNKKAFRKPKESKQAILNTLPANRQVFPITYNDVYAFAQLVVAELYRVNPTLLNISGGGSTALAPGFYPTDIVNYLVYLFFIRGNKMGCFKQIGGIEIPGGDSFDCPAPWARFLCYYFRAQLPTGGYVIRDDVFVDPPTSGTGFIQTSPGNGLSYNYTQSPFFTLYPWFDSQASPNQYQRQIITSNAPIASYTGVFTGIAPFAASVVCSEIKTVMSKMCDCIKLGAISYDAPDLSSFVFPVESGQSNGAAYTNNINMVSFSDNWDPVLAVALTPQQQNFLSNSSSISLWTKSPMGLCAQQWLQDGTPTNLYVFNLCEMAAWAFVRSDYPDNGQFTSTLKMYGVSLRSIGHIVTKPVEWSCFLNTVIAEFQTRNSMNTGQNSFWQTVLVDIIGIPAIGSPAGYAAVLQSILAYAKMLYASMMQTHGNPGFGWLWGQTASQPAQLQMCFNINNVKVPLLISQHLKNMFPVGFYHNGYKTNFLIVPSSDFTYSGYMQGWGALSTSPSVGIVSGVTLPLYIGSSKTSRTPGMITGVIQTTTSPQPFGIGYFGIQSSSLSSGLQIAFYLNNLQLTANSTATLTPTTVLVNYFNPCGKFALGLISTFVQFVFTSSPSSNIKTSLCSVFDGIANGGSPMVSLLASSYPNVLSQTSPLPTALLGSARTNASFSTPGPQVSMTVFQIYNPDAIHAEFPLQDVGIAMARNLPVTIAFRSIGNPVFPPSRYFKGLDLGQTKFDAFDFAVQVYNSEIGENYQKNLETEHEHDKIYTLMISAKPHTDCFLKAAKALLQQLGGATIHETDTISHVTRLGCEVVGDRISPIGGKIACAAVGKATQKLARSIFTRDVLNMPAAPPKKSKT